MMDVLVLAALLVILVAFAADAYHVARGQEAADRREAARLASMDRAMTDEAGCCWQCTTPARMLELVDGGDRFALLCAPCAEVTKALAGTRRQEAA